VPLKQQRNLAKKHLLHESDACHSIISNVGQIHKIAWKMAPYKNFKMDIEY
jgi:hypothetical protein